MHVKDLTDTERMGLMALLKLTISADRTLSASESRVVMRIADEMGRNSFFEAHSRAERMLTTHERLWSAIAAVSREPAQQLLHRLAVEVAISDNLLAEESQILRWVGELWTREPTPCPSSSPEACQGRTP